MPDNVRNVCVIAREPAAEQLRMAAGLTTVHEKIIVIIADHVLRPDKATQEHLEALKLMGARLLTNRKENQFEYTDDSGIASVLTGCDIVIS